MRVFVNFFSFLAYSFIINELQVVSYELWVAIVKKNIYKLRVPFYELQIVILRVANLFCEFEIKLRVASCFLQVKNLRTKIYELQVVFCELKIQKFYFTRCQLLVMSWKFKINYQEQIPVHFCYLGIIHIKGQPENI